MTSRKYPPTIAHLHQIILFVRAELVAISRFNESQIQKIELAVEEVIVNIIEHSQMSQDDFIEVNCRESIAGQGIEIVIRDSGIPYDPTSPQQQKNESEGCGLRLLFTIMDRVSYRRDGFYNELTLFFNASLG